MKGRSCIALASITILIFTVLSCGVETMESTFRDRLKELDRLEKEAPENTRAAVSAAKERFEDAYKNLPSEDGPRIKELARINQDSREFIETTRKELRKITAEGKEKHGESEKAEFASRLEKFTGDWEGPGAKLSIKPDGSVDYERISGSVKKAISDGKLVRIGTDSFDVNILLGIVSFKIDGPPRIEDGNWKITVDGVELRRR